MFCESVAEEEKMEVDHDQHQEQEKVTDREEPMETDNSAIEEQQQQQQSSNTVNNLI